MQSPLKILLSNDDGYDARGLLTLREALRETYEVIVVAPEQNCSGASSALSLRKELKITRSEPDDNVFVLNGTPADCVHVALNGMLTDQQKWQPDMVIAGINHGANLGDDIIYSGTVAAALEGRFLAMPALAVSLDGAQHYATAAEVVKRLIQTLRSNPLPTGSILNINVPDKPYSNLRGIRATRLGNRYPAQPIQKLARATYQIGGLGEIADGSAGTDFHALQAGAVSVTPLQVDMTYHARIADIAQWLQRTA